MNKKAIVAIAVLVIFGAAFLWWQRGGYSSFTIINIGNLQSQLMPFESIDMSDDGESERQGGVMYLHPAVQALQSKYPENLVTGSGDLVLGLWWRLFGGEPEFKSASMIGVNVATVGNHEFSLGPEHLKKALRDYAEFPVLAGNLEVSDPELNRLFHRNIILATSSGRKIGFFSLVPGHLAVPTQIREALKIDENLSAVASANIRELRDKGASAIVLLSHLPLGEDMALAAEVSGINVIINGDSPYGEYPVMQWVTGPGGWMTAVATSGDKGRRLTAINVALHRGATMPERTTLEVMPVTENLTADLELEAMVASFEERVSVLLDRPIGVFSTPVDARKNVTRSGETPLGDFLTDAFRWRTGAQIAVMNAGGIRGDRVFPAGPVSIRNVFEILPFQDKVWIKRMTGREIRHMLSLSASALIGDNDDHDVNQRIATGGFLHVSGLSVTLALSGINNPAIVNSGGEIVSGGNRLKAVNLVNGPIRLPINDSDTYTVAMPEFLAQGGDKYTFLKELPGRDTQMIDSDIIIDYIRYHQNQPMNLSGDGRQDIGFRKH